MDLIGRALEMGQGALDEHESKDFLAGYGIPVCREALAADPVSACELATRIGFPIALKACGPALFHKTEIGGVALNITSEARTREEGERLLTLPGCKALLVQEMIIGKRELACGMIRDEQFGPCVMYGLGGVLTELLDDVSFRIAPFEFEDAYEMIGEIRARAITGSYRGEPRVDMRALATILVELGRIGVVHREISAIDINPLLICGDGTPVAVDALVLLGARGGQDLHPRARYATEANA